MERGEEWSGDWSVVWSVKRTVLRVVYISSLKTYKYLYVCKYLVCLNFKKIIKYVMVWFGKALKSTKA